MTGRVVIFSGPSGVGKDTLLEIWSARDPRVCRVVSVTTRAPRGGEVEGEDYHFVPVEEFGRMVAEGAFFEHKNVHGNWYATPRAGLEELMTAGKIAVLKIDVQGALDVMALLPDALSVFILPPSWEELERRIRARNSDSAEAIERRLKNAREELALADRYAHRVVNDDRERAVDELERLVGSDGADTVDKS